MKTTLLDPAERLLRAFGEGVAGTYLRSYEHMMANENLHGALLATANSTLSAMREHGRTAFEHTSLLLPTLELPGSKYLAMAACVVITLRDVPAGTRLKQLPTKAQVLG